MKKVIICATLLLALFTPVSVAYGKGSTDKIFILGAEFAKPLEITTSTILDRFDPWDGQFFDRTRGIRGRLTETPIVTQTYNIFFYIRDDSNKSQVVYVFRYALNHSHTQGYIYIPTEGENWYTMNSETIARPSGWYYANREWDEVMRQALASKIKTSLNASLTRVSWEKTRR